MEGVGQRVEMRTLRPGRGREWPPRLSLFLSLQHLEYN